MVLSSLVGQWQFCDFLLIAFYSFSILACINLASSADYICPAGKSLVSFTVNEGDSFSFSTQDGAQYTSMTDCSVNYKLGSCPKMRFDCSSFDLGKGDTLFIKAKGNNHK